MKKSIFLISFLSNHCRGSNCFTSAAIFVGKSVVSNREISETPLRPSQSPFHVSSVPVPSAVTQPKPVTTTLLSCKLEPLFYKLQAVYRPAAASGGKVPMILEGDPQYI